MTGTKTLLAILAIGILIMVGVVNGADTRTAQVAVTLNILQSATIQAGTSVQLDDKGPSSDPGFNNYEGTDSISINCNDPEGFYLYAQDLLSVSPRPGHMLNPTSGDTLSTPLQIAFPFGEGLNYLPLADWGGLESDLYPYGDASTPPVQISYSDGEIGFRQLVSQNALIDTPEYYGMAVGIEVDPVTPYGPG